MNPMRLYTEVSVPPLTRQFDGEAEIFALGSCFAGEIGSRLSESGFNISVNPFGTLYNPASVAAAAERLAACRPFTAADVIYSEALGRYNSFHHHTKAARTDAETFLRDANASLETASAAFRNADICIITLGTSWVFRHIASGMIVANCNKVPAREFKRERLTAEESARLISEIISQNPGKEWILTVSPIRHLADGAYGNSLSKAALLLATEAVVKNFPNAHYFPAYEIVTDELRDYRFYAEDMVHPSAQAAELVFARFMDYAFTAAAVEAANRARKEFRRSLHRPILEGTTENMA